LVVQAAVLAWYPWGSRDIRPAVVLHVDPFENPGKARGREQTAFTQMPIMAEPSGLVSNPSETHQPEIIVSAVLTFVIGAAFVGLRFYTRLFLLRNALGVEDWLIFAALVFSAATSAGVIERQALAPLSLLGRDANMPG
jgi:hypothetical protein